MYIYIYMYIHIEGVCVRRAHYAGHYRGTSLISNSASLGSYSRAICMALWRP